MFKLVPRDVLEECPAQAARWLEEKRSQPRSHAAAAVIVAVWLAALWLAWRWAESWLAY